MPRSSRNFSGFESQERHSALSKLSDTVYSRNKHGSEITHIAIVVSKQWTDGSRCPKALFEFRKLVYDFEQVRDVTGIRDGAR